MRKFFLILFTVVGVSGCGGGDGNLEPLSKRAQPKAVFIGNSITKHEPKPEIGWYGNWGMAATSEDKDYVHLVATAIGATPQPVNVAKWETGFDAYDYSQLGALAGADAVVFKVGENVPYDSPEFAAAFEKLVTTVTARRVYVVSTWWTDPPFPAINLTMKTVAEKHGFRWVQLPPHDTSYDGYYFSDPGVAGHPGDKGMKLIADTILASMI